MWPQCDLHEAVTVNAVVIFLGRVGKSYTPLYHLLEKMASEIYCCVVHSKDFNSFSEKTNWTIL